MASPSSRRRSLHAPPRSAAPRRSRGGRFPSGRISRYDIRPSAPRQRTGRTARSRSQCLLIWSPVTSFSATTGRFATSPVRPLLWPRQRFPRYSLLRAAAPRAAPASAPAPNQRSTLWPCDPAALHSARARPRRAVAPGGNGTSTARGYRTRRRSRPAAPAQIEFLRASFGLCDDIKVPTTPASAPAARSER